MLTRTEVVSKRMDRYRSMGLLLLSLVLLAPSVVFLTL